MDVLVTGSDRIFYVNLEASAQQISLRSVCSSPKGTESEGFLFSPRHFSALPVQRRWPYVTLGLAGALSLLSIHRHTVSPSPHTSCASSPDLTEGKWVLMIFLISSTSRGSSGRGLRVFCVINVFQALHHVVISISSPCWSYWGRCTFSFTLSYFFHLLSCTFSL